MNSWTDFWASVDVLQLAVWVVGIIAVIVFFVKGWPFLRGLVRLVDTLQALPAFMESTTKTLQKQDQQIAEIHHEVNYNNGSSVKDAVARLEAAVGTKPTVRKRATPPKEKP